MYLLKFEMKAGIRKYYGWLNVVHLFILQQTSMFSTI